MMLKSRSTQLAESCRFPIEKLETAVDLLGVCAAETIEGKDLGMAEGGYAVQAWTLRHAAQEERGRGRHVGVHGVGAA